MSQPQPHPDHLQFDGFAGKGFETIFNSSYKQAYARFAKALMQIAQDMSAPISALDLGCGDGWTAQMLATIQSGRYVGIDNSEKSIERLLERMHSAPKLQCSGIVESGAWILEAGADKRIIVLQQRCIYGFDPAVFACCPGSCANARDIDGRDFVSLGIEISQVSARIAA